MKVLFVLGRYLPQKNAGIENYTHWLAKLLKEAGHNVSAAILHSDDLVEYMYEGIKVIPLKEGLKTFSELMDAQSFDCCHFQEYSGKHGINIEWFKYARVKQAKIFFTFHLPYLTCYKADFRYMGLQDCNVFTDENRCARCIIADKSGYTKSISSEIMLGLCLIGARVAGRYGALKRRIRKMHNELDELISVCDKIFIYGRWFKILLNQNGYFSDKLVEIPHITNTSLNSKKTESSGRVHNRLIFVGRIEKQKGLHLLCAALRRADIPGLELDVFGNIVDHDYFNSCKEDYPFNYMGAVPREQLLQTFKNYDFLILPSVFTEMYSLVLKEAFYAHLPVIVSSAKGNKDAVIEGETGYIFEYNSSNNLATVIENAYVKLCKGWQVQPPSVQGQDDEIQKMVKYYV